MKNIVFILLLIFPSIIYSQKKEDFLIDTYKIGFYNDQNKYVFMKDGHNVLIYSSSNNTMTATNLFNEKSKATSTLNIIYSKYYEKESLTTYLTNFQLSPLDTLLFIVPDPKLGEKRKSFAVVYKKIMYQFN